MPDEPGTPSAIDEPVTGGPTGDQEVDEALAALPSLPEGGDRPDRSLQEPIDRISAVHQRLQQRLSDLSR